MFVVFVIYRYIAVQKHRLYPLNLLTFASRPLRRS